MEKSHLLAVSFDSPLKGLKKSLFIQARFREAAQLVYPSFQALPPVALQNESKDCAARTAGKTARLSSHD
jgi:hypothetical protein